MNNTAYHCWLCAGTHTHLIKRGNLPNRAGANDFRITDANYGITADIFQCTDCRFRFCPTVADVTAHYENMDDAVYEATRAERALQAQKVLQRIKKFKVGGTLLDVGAGSGILVEQALKESFAASGIEPSRALSTTAQQLGLPVITGVLPLPEPQRFDVVTLIDVIEHVDAPRALLREVSACMRDDAICVLITPDVGSLAARLTGNKWWHYRLAHIGYFDQNTLRLLLTSSGFEVIAAYRPGWYFPASYLATRLLQYLPVALRIKIPRWLDRLTIPLNLFDSLLVICRKRAH